MVASVLSGGVAADCLHDEVTSRVESDILGRVSDVSAIKDGNGAAGGKKRKMGLVRRDRGRAVGCTGNECGYWCAAGDANDGHADEDHPGAQKRGLSDLIEGVVEITDGMAGRLAVLINVENVFLFIELLFKLAERGPKEFGFLGVVRVLLEVLYSLERYTAFTSWTWRSLRLPFSSRSLTINW